MKNLFENAYFGKAYKTRSGQKAIYLFSSGCGAYCITEEFKNTIRYFNLDGIPYDFENSKYRGEDIISEWKQAVKLYIIMKTIKLKVEIEVEDDYVLNEEDWLLEDAVLNGEYEYSVSLLEQL